MLHANFKKKNISVYIYLLGNQHIKYPIKLFGVKINISHLIILFLYFLFVKLLPILRYDMMMKTNNGWTTSNWIKWENENIKLEVEVEDLI